MKLLEPQKIPWLLHIVYFCIEVRLPSSLQHELHEDQTKYSSIAPLFFWLRNCVWTTWSLFKRNMILITSSSLVWKSFRSGASVSRTFDWAVALKRFNYNILSLVCTIEMLQLFRDFSGNPDNLILFLVNNKFLAQLPVQLPSFYGPIICWKKLTMRVTNFCLVLSVAVYEMEI